MQKVKDISGCQGCPLAAKFPDNSFVPVWYGTDHRRLVVGEAAGAEESLAGRPFVGPSGKLLQSLYRKAGVNWNSLSVVNTLSCRPPDNKYPTSAEARAYCTREEADKIVSHCRSAHLMPVLNSRVWDRIDALGEHALRATTGKQGISNWRGMPLEAKDLSGWRGQLNVIPTLHPAYLMRQQEMFPVVVSDLKKSLVIPPERYNLFPTLDDVKAFKATELAIDIECNRYNHNEIYMVGLSAARFEAMVVPFEGAYIAELRRIFSAAKVVKGQNIIQFDLPVLAENGIVTHAQPRDIMLMHHLLQPDLAHDLEFIASVFTSKPAWKYQAKTAKEYYNAVDTDIVNQIEPQLYSLLRQEGLLELYEKVSVPVSRICHLMTQKGIRLNAQKCNEVRKAKEAEQQVLEQSVPTTLRTGTIAVNRRIPAPAGTLGKSRKPVKFLTVPTSEPVVPWRSDKVVGEWLYQELKLPVQKHVKTNKPSTDKYSLERLARLYPEHKEPILAIKELRSLDEMLTTFAREASGGDRTIMPHFSVHGTNSGRLSSSGPNAQNIPEEMRVMYGPHKANSLIVSADFSGIENRLTAYLAGDTERLARLDEPGFSEHKWLASLAFNIPLEDVKKSSDPDSPYSKAKHVVHGSNYGLGPRKMSMMYGFPEKEAKVLLAKWKALIPKTVAWQERIANEAKHAGYLTNPFGRKRWFGTSSYFTESLSFLPQSCAADVILRCMVGLYFDRIGLAAEEAMAVSPRVRSLSRQTHLLVQVHDSLVWECPKDQLEPLIEALEYVMSQPWSQLGGYSVPIAITYGPSWGEQTDYVRKQAA